MNRPSDSASIKTWKKYLTTIDEIERTNNRIESLQAIEDVCGSEHLACLLNFESVEKMLEKINKDAAEILKKH